MPASHMIALPPIDTSTQLQQIFCPSPWVRTSISGIDAHAPASRKSHAIFSTNVCSGVVLRYRERYQ